MSQISKYGADTVDGARAMLVVDGRIDMRNHLGTYYIRKPGEEVRYKSEPAQTQDTSSLTFSIIPPNKTTAIDKRMYLKCYGQFTFSGDAGVGNKLFHTKIVNNGPSGTPVEYLVSETDALRFLPIQSNAESVRFTLNSSDVSQNSSDIIEPLCRYGYNKEMYSKEYSIFPSFQDSYQEYNDFTIWGDAKNSLASFGNNDSRPPRGSLRYELSSNTQTSAVVKVQWVEPILLSPLQVDRLVQRGFLGLTEIDARFNMSTKLSRLWSHDAVGNDVNLAVDSFIFTANPEIRLCYINLVPGQLGPLTNNYPYYRISRFPNNLGVLGPGDSTGIKDLQNIQLSSIPSKMYVFARQSNDTRTFTDTDSYMRLKQIQIQFDNRPARLSEAKPEDLYQISVLNGCEMSWPEWYDKTGSVFCADFGRDIGLRDYQSVGMRGQWQLQISINFENIGTRSKTITCWIVILSEGAFKIVDTQTFVQTGDVYPINVKEAVQGRNPDVAMIHEEDAFSYQGGSFLGKVKKWAHRAMPYVLKTGKMIEKYGPQVAAMLAAGESGSGLSGNGMSGGRRMSRYSLENRM
jgi:hypothetical protein